MMDAAQDPRVGKRVDFGVDVMKKMIVNAFTSFLPVCAQQHRRNEQGDLLKTSIPAWYFSSLRAQNPPSRFLTKGSSQKQSQDALPMKLRRRKRGSSNSEIPSDVLMIPLDFVQQGKITQTLALNRMLYPCPTFACIRSLYISSVG